MWPDHPHQVLAFRVLGRGARRQPFGSEIRRPAELIDTLRHRHHVRLLFLRVLRELGLHALARNPRGGDRVHRVAQHADDPGRQHGLQDGNGLAGIALVVAVTLPVSRCWRARSRNVFTSVRNGVAADLLIGAASSLGLRTPEASPRAGAARAAPGRRRRDG